MHRCRVNEMVLKPFLGHTILLQSLYTVCFIKFPNISMVCVKGKIHIYTKMLVLHRLQEVPSTRWQQCLLWVGGRVQFCKKIMGS